MVINNIFKYKGYNMEIHMNFVQEIEINTKYHFNKFYVLFNTLTIIINVLHGNMKTLIVI